MTAVENKEKRTAKILLNDRDRRILSFIARFRLLSRDQLMMLAPFNSLTRANTRLAALVRLHLLTRKSLPVYPGNGSAQSLYYLGRKAAQCIPVDGQAFAAQVRQISRWESRQIDHVLAANGVIVTFIKALKCEDNFNLQAFYSEPELRQVFLNRDFVPDGWLAWVAAGRRFNCFLEVDLHHEGLNKWRKKADAYLRYVDSDMHEQCFGFRAFRVLVLAKSTARLQNLRRTVSHCQKMFLFADLNRINTANILGRSWLPGENIDPISLIEA